MALSSVQLQRYANEGYLLLTGVLDEDCLSQVEAELQGLQQQASDGHVLEQDGRTIRSIYCSHLKTGRLAVLVRDERVLGPALQLLGADAYLYQLKVNFKRAHTGDAWSWHQDFVYWNNEDGLPSPSLVNAVIFLDDVTQENGPIQLIAGSHMAGSLPPQSFIGQSTLREVIAGDRYTLSDAQVMQLREAGRQVQAVGKRGSVLYFHPNVAHSSSDNRSDQDRKLCLITYCDVHNRPSLSRPEYLVGRNYLPLRPLAFS
jgi:ectoine hydroxylase